MGADCWQTSGWRIRRTEEWQRERKREKVDIISFRKKDRATKISKKERRQNLRKDRGKQKRLKRRKSDRQKRESPRFTKVQHSEEFGLRQSDQNGSCSLAVHNVRLVHMHKSAAQKTIFTFWLDHRDQPYKHECLSVTDSLTDWTMKLHHQSAEAWDNQISQNAFHTNQQRWWRF